MERWRNISQQLRGSLRAVQMFVFFATLWMETPVPWQRKRHICRSSTQVKTQKLNSCRSFTLPTEIFNFRRFVAVGKVRDLKCVIRVKFKKVLLETAINLPCGIADPIISSFPKIEDIRLTFTRIYVFLVIHMQDRTGSVKVCKKHFWLWKRAGRQIKELRLDVAKWFDEVNDRENEWLFVICKFGWVYDDMGLCRSEKSGYPRVKWMEWNGIRKDEQVIFITYSWPLCLQLLRKWKINYSILICEHVPIMYQISFIRCAAHFKNHSLYSLHRTVT